MEAAAAEATCPATELRGRKIGNLEKGGSMGGGNADGDGRAGFYRKAVIVGALAVAIVITVWLKRARSAGSERAERRPAPAATGGTAPQTETDASRPGADAPEPRQPTSGLRSETAAPKPKLLELGSTTCIPCKMMEGVLARLRQDYSDRLLIEFVDVTVNRSASEQWKIKVIPTQIFLSPDGKELFRHEGFYPKDDIVRKWKDLGYDLDAAPPPATPPAGRAGR
ncbi:MAG: thioredoxin family protein [Planctomycetota bacterium]|nr:thioredoxin family protein [Planctomycetota bacterium]